MPDYIPTKVLLHDPDSVTNPKSLYPVTGLNAIYAGTSGTAATTSITNTSNQIKCEYLELVDSATGKVYTVYLPIEFVEGTGKIDNDSLDIFSGDGKIKADLLPGFVEDVVDVPVLTAGYPSVGSLMIRATDGDNGPVYTFMQKTSGNTWVEGGGESGKIYVASDTSTTGIGSIFRCVSGSTTEAICISNNPYAIAETVTNGVSLHLDNSTLTAQAVSATTNRLGTIQVDNTATNNVKLTITNGIVAASAGTAGNDTVGVVFAAGNSAVANTLINEYGGTYVVPTAQYMHDYVTSAITGVDYATSSVPGIVQIGSNINVGDSGLISVSSATADSNGVVKIVDTIATTAAGNTGNTAKAVTLGGITTYVGAVLGSYQYYLSNGPGVTINRTFVESGFDKITLNTSGAVVISGTYVTARDATNAETGVVIITGDSSLITNETVEDASGHPIAVNGKAVKDYVATAISESASIPIPTANVRGGFRTSASDTGLTLGTAGGVADVLKINTAAPLYIDAQTNKLTASAGALGQAGVVNVVSTSAQVVNADYATYVPNNAAVKDYVASEIASAGGQGALIPRDGIFIGDVTEGAIVTSNVISAKLADPLRFDDNGSMTVSTGATLYISAHALHVSSATYSASAQNPAKLGAVYLANDVNGTFAETDPYAATPKYVADKIAAMGVDGSAVYTPDSASVSSGGVAIPLGGVRVVSDGGIKVNSGNIYLQPAEANILGGVKIPANSGLAVDNTGVLTLQSATSTHLGGIQLAATSTGLVMSDGVLSANLKTPLWHSGSAIAVSTAAVGADGVVNVLTSAAGITAAAEAATINAVPNAAGLSAYVSANNATLDGAGLIWSGGSLNIKTKEPIQLDVDSDAVAIRTAAAETGATLTSAAKGAVYVRGAVRSASVIEADAQGITLNTVPTESAVRSLTDSTSTTIMNTIDARLYITYTPLN